MLAVLKKYSIHIPTEQHPIVTVPISTKLIVTAHKYFLKSYFIGTRLLIGFTFSMDENVISANGMPYQIHILLNVNGSSAKLSNPS